MSGIMNLLNDSHGINIPMMFARDFCSIDNLNNRVIKNVDREQIDVLLDGPDNELYWEVWDEVLQTCEIEFGNNIYHLEQEGDLFAMCYDEMTPEEYKNFDMEDGYKHYEEDELVKEFEDSLGEYLDKSDNIMMSQEFSNWMDSLYSEGEVTNYQVQNFCYPDDE